MAKPPERLSVSAWCDRYRVLDSINNSRPGPWSTDFTPYLREILDRAGRPGTREIVVMSSTQVGKTEAEINVLLRLIDCDPKPVLFVQPTEKLAKSFLTRRLKPAIEHCAPVHRRRTQNQKGDWKSDEIAFDAMVLYMGWANSASALSSRPIGAALLDELDKWPLFAGREADPVSLVRERLRTFGDSLLFAVSTPTLQDGYIAVLYRSSDRRRYFVPCPFCGAFQELQFFPPHGIVWPKDVRDPDRIASERMARYRCAGCERLIDDDDDHKRRMLEGGVWKPEDAEVLPDGRLRSVPKTSRYGYQLSALYSPWLSWSEVAAEFLRSKDDVGSYMNFTNSWLGLPWIERTAEISLEKLKARADRDLEQRRVPRTAELLVAGVDVQDDGIYYVIRACGRSERSWTIDAGRIPSFDVLRQVLTARYDLVGAEEGDDPMPLALATIDAMGHRTDEVYQFVRDMPYLCRPIKGEQTLPGPFRTTKIDRDYLGRAHGLQLWQLNTTFFKDKLAAHMTADLGTPSSWRPWGEATEEYLLQLTSEHKVLVRSKTKSQVKTVWVPKRVGIANHFWDCEVYATAALEMLGAYAIRDEHAPAPPKPERGRIRPGADVRQMDFRAKKSPRGGWIRRRR